MGKRREATVKSDTITEVERLEADLAARGETWEEYGKRMAMETPVEFKLIPPPDLRSHKDVGRYELDVLSDVEAYLGHTAADDKRPPSANLLSDLYGARRVIGHYLADGKCLPIVDKRKDNIAELVTLLADDLERDGFECGTGAPLFARSLKEATARVK